MQTDVWFAAVAFIIPRQVVLRNGLVSSAGARQWHNPHWWHGYLYCWFGRPQNQADCNPPGSCPVCRYSKVAVFDRCASVFLDSEIRPARALWSARAVAGLGLSYPEMLTSLGSSWGLGAWILLVFYKLHHKYARCLCAGWADIPVGPGEPWFMPVSASYQV